MFPYIVAYVSVTRVLPWADQYNAPQNTAAYLRNTAAYLGTQLPFWDTYIPVCELGVLLRSYNV